MKIFISRNTIFILFLVFCFLPRTSLAVNVFGKAEKSVFTLSDEFLVRIYLDTENTTINAVEGRIVFPSDILSVKEIREGDSVINFWIEKPQSVKNGEISFSGITTGGFSGTEKLLFGIVFKSKKINSASLMFEDFKALQNDGNGTPVFTTMSPFSFAIIGGANSPDMTKVEDAEIPEDFTPLIGRDPSMFDGKYFIVFSTVDKGVGIDHYEIREGFMNNYTVAESPYVLEDQHLSSTIYVKAVDRAGNKRIVEIKAQNSVSRLNLGIIFGIILAVCILAWKRRRSRFIKS